MRGAHAAAACETIFAALAPPRDRLRALLRVAAALWGARAMAAAAAPANGLVNGALEIMSGADMLAMLSTRKTTSEELVRACYARIAARDDVREPCTCCAGVCWQLHALFVVCGGGVVGWCCGGIPCTTNTVDLLLQLLVVVVASLRWRCIPVRLNRFNTYPSRHISGRRRMGTSGRGGRTERW
eukprot:COSAG01_NODE_1928_length_8876_cov_12.801641_11_plen_184_part_00